MRWPALPLRPVRNYIITICWPFILVALLFVMTPASAQTPSWPDPETEQQYRAAEKALLNGHYRQAVVGFQQLQVRMPGNFLVERSLAQALLRSGDPDGAEKILGKLVNDSAADGYTFVLAAQTQSALGSEKQALKQLNRGLEKFPEFGLLYYEKGKLYERQSEPAEALKAWVAGIHVEPEFHLNYYEAAKSYLKTSDFFWGMIYAEVFVNLETETPRSQEMRKSLLDAYKRFYFTTDGQKSLDNKNDFKNNVCNILMKLAPVASDGVTTESMTMLRTRLSLDWDAIPLKQYSCSLFDWFDELIREGHFDAYNQWLVGAADQASSFEAWKKFHTDAIPSFEVYRKKKSFKPRSTDPQPQNISKQLFKSASTPKR